MKLKSIVASMLFGLVAGTAIADEHTDELVRFTGTDGVQYEAFAARKKGVGLDGYRFTNKSFERFDIRIKIERHWTLDGLRDSAQRKGMPNWKTIGAYSLVAMNKPDHPCEIHIVSPEAAYIPDAVGHELFHCIYGDFHPGQ